MVDDYTPTRTAVRNSYTSRRSRYGQRAVTAKAEFDRWLAEHDAKVRAEAWDEGFDAWMEFEKEDPGPMPWPTVEHNPYRREEQS